MAMKDIDVAMESTSQEILEKVGVLVPSDAQNITVKSFQYSTAGEKTLIDIAGKGKLYGACVGGGTYDAKAKRITITVDGVVVCDLMSSNTKTSKFVGYLVGIINPNYLTCHYDGSGYIDISYFMTRFSGYTASEGSMSPRNVITKIAEFSPELQTQNEACSANYSGLVHGAYIDTPIPFEHSLKITMVSSEARQTKGIVGYTLED